MVLRWKTRAPAAPRTVAVQCGNSWYPSSLEYHGHLREAKSVRFFPSRQRSRPGLIYASRARGIVVSAGSMIGRSANSHLQLRPPTADEPRSAGRAYRLGIPRAGNLAGLILLVLDRALELNRSHEGIEILAYETVLVAPRYVIAPVPACRIARGGSRPLGPLLKFTAVPVVAGWELHPLQRPGCGSAQAPGAADDLTSARALKDSHPLIWFDAVFDEVYGVGFGCPEVVWRAHDRMERAHSRPFGIGTVTHAHGEVAFNRLLFDFHSPATSAGFERSVGGSRGVAAPVPLRNASVDVVLL